MGNKITRRRAVIDERYTRPQGLYPCHDVDHRKLRRLILDSKLAPCYPGAEDPASELEECPICFLQYPSLNRSKCCTKGVCTECFLQMKAPHANRPTQCPFCKTPSYAVEYRGAKTLEEKGMEQAEEQKVIEAKIRMRQQELQDDEEREQRREEDIRLSRIRLETPRAQPSVRSNYHPTSTTSIDETDGLNWRPGWISNADRQEQVCVATPERITDPGIIDPYSWWADGGFDIPSLFQQSAVPMSPNNIPSMNQQQTEMDFPAPRFPPGAPRSRHRDSDEFDLDLEDIMVMEAIWLSIQEQGARHRFADVEANRPSEPVTEDNLDSEAGVDPATGGLALAIAALAERQASGGNVTAPGSQSSIRSVLPQLDPEVDRCRAGEEASDQALEDTGSESGTQSSHRNPEEPSEENGSVEIVAPTSAREEEEAESIPRSGASESEKVGVTSKQEENRSSLMRSKSLAEIGTSFASYASSESELTWETPQSSPSEVRNGEHDEEKVMLPDSFEERMMLAMALSIASDAQSSSMRHQEDTSSSGPLPQPSQ